MNWKNIDLSSADERAQNILDSYDFDTLLLEIDYNLPEINRLTVTATFETELRAKLKSARKVFMANVDDIVAYAQRQRQDLPLIEVREIVTVKIDTNTFDEIEAMDIAIAAGPDRMSVTGSAITAVIDGAEAESVHGDVAEVFTVLERRNLLDHDIIFWTD